MKTTRTQRRPVVLASVLVLICIMPVGHRWIDVEVAVHAEAQENQAPQPLTMDQVRELMGLAPDPVVAGEVRDRGVAFEVTRSVIVELQGLGIGPETEAVLRSFVSPNRAPLITLEVERQELILGETASVRAMVTDPDHDPLTFRWFTSAGSIEGTGPSVTLKTEGIGTNTKSLGVLVGLEVDDGRGGITRQAVGVDVRTPNHAPSALIKAERSEIQVGEFVVLQAEAKDPDGDDLTYIWETTLGRIIGQGSSVILSTAGIEPTENLQRIVVDLEIRDDRKGTVTTSTTLSLVQPPATYTPAEAIEKVSPRYPSAARSLRVSGEVAVEVTIDEFGNVLSAVPMEGPKVFHREAVSAAMLWKFRPARRGDRAVASTKKISFNFSAP